MPAMKTHTGRRREMIRMGVLRGTGNHLKKLNRMVRVMADVNPWHREPCYSHSPNAYKECAFCRITCIFCKGRHQTHGESCQWVAADELMSGRGWGA